MSEHESGYQEIDLDKPGSTAAEDIEIVEEGVEVIDETAEPVPTSVTPAPAPTDEDDEEGDDEDDEPKRKRLTRSQRLKAQRDHLAAEAEKLRAELAELRTKSSKHESDAQEGAAIALDVYIKSIDDSMRAIRAEYDRAFDTGDREALFNATQKMGELQAEKKLAERDRRSIPTQAARQSGGEARPQTQQTTAPSPPQAAPGGNAGPSPAALRWHKRNQWFGQDPIMTVAARMLDQQLVGEGYEPDDPDYFSELDKRVREAFPHKFTEAQAKPAPASPTISQRNTPPATTGKIKVTITAEDRRMANMMGIDIQDYAREKAKIERSKSNANEYTEIL